MCYCCIIYAFFDFPSLLKSAKQLIAISTPFDYPVVFLVHQTNSNCCPNLDMVDTLLNNIADYTLTNLPIIFY